MPNFDTAILGVTSSPTVSHRCDVPVKPPAAHARGAPPETLTIAEHFRLEYGAGLWRGERPGRPDMLFGA